MFVKSDQPDQIGGAAPRRMACAVSPADQTQSPASPGDGAVTIQMLRSMNQQAAVLAGQSLKPLEHLRGHFANSSTADMELVAEPTHRVDRPHIAASRFSQKGQDQQVQQVPTSTSWRHGADQAATVAWSDSEQRVIEQYHALMQSPVYRLSISRIADRIIAAHPLASPSLLMFVAPLELPDVDLVSLAIARELAARDVGRVLMVDGCVRRQRLSRRLSGAGQVGLADLISRPLHPKACIVSTELEQLDFLAAGTCPLTHRRMGPTRMQALSAQLRESYQFVCISGSVAGDLVPRNWGRFCDGTYLLVHIDRIDRVIVQVASRQLRFHAARLSGCIALTCGEPAPAGQLLSALDAASR